jgi:hypothetical protein
MHIGFIENRLIKRLSFIGAASCLLFALAYSHSSIIKSIDGAYSRVIVQEIDNKKAAYGLQRQCQIIQARLIDMLLTPDKDELLKLKKAVYKDFQDMDKRIESFGKTAATGEIKRFVLSVTNSLLVYRRACATYVVLMDENKISEASMFLRFNVQRSFTSATTALSDIPEQLDRNLQNQSEKMTNSNVTMASIIQNAASLPVFLWFSAAVILFATYWGIPAARFKR